MHKPPDLSITTEHNSTEAVISLRGRVTIDTSPELRTSLSAMLQDESLNQLTINLTDAEYIDCSGLATLVEALRRARRRSIEIELSGLHDRVLYLLQVAGLLTLFQNREQQRMGSVKVTG